MSGTQGGGANPSANVMLNVPIVDDKLAIRFAGTDKFVSGWIDRVVVSPLPEAADPCAAYSAGTTAGCVRGNLLAPGISKQVIPDVNWELLESPRLSILFTPTPALSIETLVMYQRIAAGGYNEYDSPPGATPLLAHYEPFNTPESVSDTFKLYSTTINYDLGFGRLTLQHVLLVARGEEQSGHLRSFAQ